MVWVFLHYTFVIEILHFVVSILCVVLAMKSYIVAYCSLEQPCNTELVLEPLPGPLCSCLEDIGLLYHSFNYLKGNRFSPVFLPTIKNEAR